jgi:hypothetical protein
MLSPGVAHPGIVKAPVDLAFAFRAFDQGMTEFMKDHLPQVIIGIELIFRCNQKGP